MQVKKHTNEVLWITIIGVIGRLITPLPNITPLMGTSLFVGTRFPKFLSLLSIFITLLVSDICLAFMRGYPVFGYFTLFTYTGFVCIVLLGSKFRYSRWSFPFYILGSSLGYWLWTNFGVWLASGLYQKSFDGLVTCYYFALPFLRNALIGDVIWCCVIFGPFHFFVKREWRNLVDALDLGSSRVTYESSSLSSRRKY